MTEQLSADYQMSIYEINKELNALKTVINSYDDKLDINTLAGYIPKLINLAGKSFGEQKNNIITLADEWLNIYIEISKNKTAERPIDTESIKNQLDKIREQK